MSTTTHPGASADRVIAVLFAVDFVSDMQTFLIVALPKLLAAVAVLRVVPRQLSLQLDTLATLGAALADRRGMNSVLFTASYLGAVHVLYTYLAPLLQSVQRFGHDGVTLVLLVVGPGAVVGMLAGSGAALGGLSPLGLRASAFALRARAHLWPGEWLAAPRARDARTVAA